MLRLRVNDEEQVWPMDGAKVTPLHKQAASPL